MAKAAEVALEAARPGSTLGLGISVVKENDGATERKHYFRRRKNSRTCPVTVGASSSGNFCQTPTNAGMKLKDRELEILDRNFVDLTVDSNGKTSTSVAEKAFPELSFLQRHHRASYSKPRTASASRTSLFHAPAEAEIWILESEAGQTSSLARGFSSRQEAKNEGSCSNNGFCEQKGAATTSSGNVNDSLGVSSERNVREKDKQKGSIPPRVSKQVSGFSSNPGQVRGCKRKRPSLTDLGTSCQRFKPPRNVQDCSTSGSSIGGMEQPIEIDILESPSNSTIVEKSPSASPNKAKQIIEDELLAKFLQEDYEMEASGGNSIFDDADLARMLQEEENQKFAQRRAAPSFQAASASVLEAANREMQRVLPTIRSPTRAASSSRMRILRNLHSRSHQHAVRGGRQSITDSSEHLLHFPEELDLETRVELLAALETVSQGTLTTADHMGREFNEGDYEMLLALDDTNHGRSGASYRKIEQLPISVVKPTDVYQEMCSICLEIPVVDDAVRRLPCMHGFHLECIDEWLARQANCPICKMKI